MYPSDGFIPNWNKRVRSKSVDGPNISRGLDLREQRIDMRWTEQS